MPTRNLKVTPFESALLITGLNELKLSFVRTPPIDTDEEATLAGCTTLTRRLTTLWEPGTDTKRRNK